MKVYFAPTLAAALNSDVEFDVTVEAEYGDNVVAGTYYTAAHHGSRHANPAPCVDEWIPYMPEAAVLVSHLDLDTIGGLARVAGLDDMFDDNTGFWQVAAFVDVHGDHEIESAPDYTPAIARQIHAFKAWLAERRRARGRDPSDRLTDVTLRVLDAVTALERILHDDPGLLAAGDEMVRQNTALDGSSLVAQYGRLLVRESDRFTNHLYRPGCDIILARNTERGTVTLSTARPTDLLNCAATLQAIFGPEAGGRATIAGSPRGRVVSNDEWQNAIERVREIVGEL